MGTAAASEAAGEISGDEGEVEESSSPSCRMAAWKEN